MPSADKGNQNQVRSDNQKLTKVGNVGRPDQKHVRDPHYTRNKVLVTLRVVVAILGHLVCSSSLAPERFLEEKCNENEGEKQRLQEGEPLDVFKKWSGSLILHDTLIFFNDLKVRFPKEFYRLLAPLEC